MGANIANFTKEERALAASLIEEKRITLWELQQGCEWCERNKKTLLSFLQRFRPDDATEMQEPEGETGTPSRRLFVRHDADRGLAIEIDGQLIEASTLNISRGGVAFKCPRALELGSEIKVGADLKIRAVVRYCVDNGDATSTAGAEFAPQTVDDLQAIEMLMTSLKVRAIGAD